jgi:hypothetical protein
MQKSRTCLALGWLGSKGVRGDAVRSVAGMAPGRRTRCSGAIHFSSVAPKLKKLPCSTRRMSPAQLQSLLFPSVADGQTEDGEHAWGAGT